MIAFWRAHKLLVTAFALSTLLTLFFVTRLVVGLVYWSMHAEEPVRPWMTVGYVGKSWDLNPRMIDREAGLPPPDGHPLTLAEIAAARGVPVETVIAEVEAAVARLKAAEKQDGAP
jgi:hypothetical protein